MPGKGGLVLTGQLGDVMKESARIALTYVKSHATELGIDEGALDGREVHVHVPAGAIPKDGPSAGITMVTAIASLLTGRPVKSTIGMTGEVTLQGRVLPIGGLKQKVLAAHAAGLTEVIVPERNGPDLDDVPSDVRDQHAVPPGGIGRSGAGAGARSQGDRPRGVIGPRPNALGKPAHAKAHAVALFRRIVKSAAPSADSRPRCGVCRFVHRKSRRARAGVPCAVARGQHRRRASLFGGAAGHCERLRLLDRGFDLVCLRPNPGPAGAGTALPPVAQP